MTEFATPPALESIAIIGMSGRFPKAKNLDEFWRNLRDGVECVSFFSETDLAAAGVDLGQLTDPYFVNAGGVLEAMDLFDASFFGFNARDAEVMDPQHRIFLECAWHSLEDAGYNPEAYPGLIGVFAGTSMSSYIFDLYSDPGIVALVGDLQVALGNEKDHLTTQVSYKLNLKGPSMVVQTSCSTSLVAVCMACQSLLNHQCDMALAGGVAADILTRAGYTYQPGGILSPDGRCRAFDAAAQGTVGGNGVGIVVLKRLSEAIADRDHIRAVIKGFAVNNDGSLKVGYTAPSVDGQAQVIAMAQALAGINPETIDYIEAHGTGTPLGDPIEIAALTKVFRARTKKKRFCAIGSVKSNIGHLDTAAGVAGLIKTVLALEHRAVPPSLHFTQPNPNIDFATSPFYVNTQLSEWKPSNHPRRAGVSSFGIGGTNAHVVVEEAPNLEPSRHSRPFCLLTLSARTNSALEAATDDLVDYLTHHPTVALADVAYSYHVGRKAFRYRRTLVCPSDDTEDAKSALDRRDPQRVFSAMSELRDQPVFFLFPGQGTQSVDMARDIYRTEPTFRSQIDRCSDILRSYLGLDLRDLLYPTLERRREAEDTLGRTAYTQPALFAIEYALARLWMEWGVRPAAMIGHSIGEYVAACLADVFSLEDALALVAIRGQMMDRIPMGAMMAVPLSELAVQRYLHNGLSLAAVNGPSSCVLSGPSNVIDELTEQLAKGGVSSHRLRTSHAFHSSMMAPAESPFVDRVRTVRLQPPQIPYVSNVTGTWITPDEAVDPNYWGHQLRRTVRFSDGLQSLLETPDCILLEVGPGQILSNLARQQPGRSAQQVILSTFPSLPEQQSDVPSLLTALGKLWLRNAEVNWNGFHVNEQRGRVPVPTYPFERQRYWFARTDNADSVDTMDGVSERRDVADWFYYPSWKPALPPAPDLEAEPDEKRSRWLVFSDLGGLGSQLIHRLRQNGNDVTSVSIGEEFAQVDLQGFVIRPQERGDYELLLSTLQVQSGLPDSIVHFWSVSSPKQQPDAISFEQCQDLGFFSLTFLVQALGEHNPLDPIQISVVSNHIHVVHGDEVPCPPKATVLALCKVIPQEYGNIRCRAVDIDFYESNHQYENRLVELLHEELTVAPFEPVVAYRKGRRWIQTYEPVRLEEATPPASRIRAGGVYLITGGLGKIGLVLAEFLARTAPTKLVLTGRSVFPERGYWDALLETTPTGAMSDRIRKLMRLEELGAEVLVVSADVADREQMRAVVQEAEARFGAIHGVIHGAGDTETTSLLSEIDRASAEQQFRPKAGGILVLDELFRDRELDFVLLLSSLSSILGGLGLGAYAAANTYLDAVASQRNHEGAVPWITVNWDSWVFPKDGELDPEDVEGVSEGIWPDEGQDAFGRILARAPRQIVVSTSDLQARLDQWIRLESVPEISQLQIPAPVQHHPRPNLVNPYVAPTSEVEITLAEIWQQLLGVAPIGRVDNFFDLGGHSLLAIQLISHLRQTFQIELPVHRVFEAPTIAELTEIIEKSRTLREAEDLKTIQLLDIVERLSDSEVKALLEESDDSPREVKLQDG